MSSLSLFLIVIAGVVAVFLFLAFLAWGIRARRGEENFIPAPENLKKRDRPKPDSSGQSQAYSDWLRERGRATPSPAAPESVPEWMKGMEQAAPGPSGRSEKTPIGAEPASPFGDFLRGVFPQLSTLKELAELIRAAESTGADAETSEERTAEVLRAVEAMIEKRPNVEFLRQMRDQIRTRVHPDENPADGGRVQVFQVAGRTVILADGVEYSSPEEIPDPVVSREARRMIEPAGTQSASFFDDRIQIVSSGGRNVLLVDGIVYADPGDIQDDAIREHARRILSEFNNTLSS
jgi:hypothetical protein